MFAHNIRMRPKGGARQQLREGDSYDSLPARLLFLASSVLHRLPLLFLPITYCLLALFDKWPSLAHGQDGEVYIALLLILLILAGRPACTTF